MTKVLKLFFWITIVFAFSACKEDVPAPYPAPQYVAEKTIFIHMPWTASRGSASGSLYKFFIDNIKHIEKGIEAQGGTGKTRILVFIDSLSPKNAELFEIKYKNGRCYHEMLHAYNQSNTPAYTTPQGLTALLNEVKRIAPAHIYSMIIGCHGVGWLPVNPTRTARTRYFGGTSPDYQTDIATLAQSIRNAGMHMQYIMFDDCYMSNIETAYVLRDVTQYLIACTSEIMAYGMPYDRMWRDLSALEPDYQRITDTFFNFYNNYRAPSYNCGAIGVTNCKKTEEMATLLKEINARYTFNTADTALVQKLDGYKNTIFFDMGSYVKRLCPDPALYSRFQSLLGELTPHRAVTSRIYTEYNDLPSHYITVNEFSGITISDASESPQFGTRTAKRTTDWWRATH